MKHSFLSTTLALAVVTLAASAAYDPSSAGGRGVAHAAAELAPQIGGGGAATFLVVTDFGAIGDGVTDDTAAIQAALDAVAATGVSSVVWFPTPVRTYKTSRTLVVKRHWTHLAGNGAQIDFRGEGPALDAELADGRIYLQRVSISGLVIRLYNEGATGIHWRFTFSEASRVGITLTARNQVGVLLAGYPNGTGPYNNTFMDITIQGSAHLGVTGQKGWIFTSHPSMPTRSPNANVIIHGRTGQVEVGWTVQGAGNVIYGVTGEGITNTVFDIDHPSSPVGTVSTGVKDVYIESGGATGVTAFRIGPNATDTEIVHPYVTGIPLARLVDDAGQRTSVYAGFQHTIPTRNLTFKQPSAADLVSLEGASPGLRLKDTLSGNALGIFSGTGVPTFAAGNGSLYLRQDGAEGSTLYVRERGAWVAK